MRIGIEVLPYRRPFATPLRTSAGEWRVREGFLVRLESPERAAFGEVAPLPRFGTETVDEAAAFLRGCGTVADAAESAGRLAEAPPSCAFGLGCALASLSGEVWATPRSHAVAALLPAGGGAREAAAGSVAAGFRTLKWKIGTLPYAEETGLLRELVRALPEGVRLRADANGALSPEAMRAWLAALAECRDCVDFLEQPLPPGAEDAMGAAAHASGVPVALDESLHAKGGSRWLGADVWKGPLVLKPSLWGDPAVLAGRLSGISGRVVLSSAFETLIGLENVLKLADRMPGKLPPLGLDTPGAFADGLSPLPRSAQLTPQQRSASKPETVWKQVPPSPWPR